MQVEADFFQFGGQVLRFDAVFSCRAHQFAHALFLFGQFVGVDVGPRGDIAHVGADFAEFGFDAGEHVEAFGKARFDGLQAAEEFLAAVYLPLYAVVAVYGFAGFCGGLQQFGGMGEAVVALVEGFPFALLEAELVEFVELPFQPFALDGGVFGLIPRFVQGFFGVFPILVALSDGFRLFQTAGEGVEQAALGGFLIEGVVRVLAVDVDKLFAYGLELGECGGLIVDVAAAFAFDVDDAADAEFFRTFVQQPLRAQLFLQAGQAGKVEQGGEAGFFRAAADLAVIGFVAQEQAECVKRDGFACAGFAGEYGKAVLKIQIKGFDDYEVA